VIVAEAAESEPVPKVVVDELSSGSLAHVSGQQSEGHILSIGESGHQLGCARQQITLTCNQRRFQAA